MSLVWMIQTQEYDFGVAYRTTKCWKRSKYLGLICKESKMEILWNCYIMDETLGWIFKNESTKTHLIISVELSLLCQVKGVNDGGYTYSAPRIAPDL